MAISTYKIFLMKKASTGDTYYRHQGFPRPWRCAGNVGDHYPV